MANNAPILPYFGGSEGEACRVAKVADWVAQNTTFKNDLDAVMATASFAKAKSYCQVEIDAYNRASALVCLLEKDDEEYPLKYNTFWGDQDGVYFDGDYDLATMFSQTNNFTEIGITVPCLADCYTGLGDGCSPELIQWLPHYGEIPLEEYCDFAFAGIDNGYNAIKLCAIKAIGQPANITMKEFVDVYEDTQATEALCHFRYCNPEVFGTIQKSISNATTATSSGGNERVILRQTMMMGMIIGLLLLLQ